MAEDRSEIAFFDIETTVPLKPGQGFAILEFGAILVCPKKLVELESYSTLIRPGNLSLLSSKSERCNGITRDAVSVAPPFSAIADKVFDLLHGRIWAGHNILRFDCPRIREAFAEIGRPPPEPKGTIDSLALLTERFGRRAGNMKMATLATYFGLGKQTHRSLDDVRMNLEVLKYCATVLFLESSLPDILANNSLVSPSTARRTRSGGRVLPMEINNTTNAGSLSENHTNNPTLGEQILNFIEPTRPKTEAFNMRRLSEEIMDDAIQENLMEEQPRPVSESPYTSDLCCTDTGTGTQMGTETGTGNGHFPKFEGGLAIDTSPSTQTGTGIDSCLKFPCNIASHPPMMSESCSNSFAFLTPDDVSIPSINISLFPFYRGSRRLQILHNNVILKLLCTHLKVRFGMSTKFVDQAGRPRLSFVVDAPPSLCQVLDACDNHAQSMFMQSGSTSDWRPVVTRKNGYWNFPTVRLHIPTVVTGDIAKYGTEIFQKEAASGTEQKFLFSKFDAAELETLFTPETYVDAFVSLDTYDYQQNAGIRLVAEKLVIHSK